MLGNKIIYSVPCLIRKFNSVGLENEFGLNEDSVFKNNNWLLRRNVLFLSF